MDHKSCSRCNAGMPSFRVNHLCEECYAEEWDSDYDSEADEDWTECPCPACGNTGWQWGDDGIGVECGECNS